MKSPVIRWLVGVLLVLILIAGIGWAVVWMKITALKKDLVSNLQDALGAQVQITTLHFDLWHGELQAAGISLTNERPDAPWDKGEISQATIRFHLRDLLDSQIPLSVEVSSWNIILHPYASGMPSSSALSSALSKSAIRVTQLTAHQGEAEIHLSNSKKVFLHGLEFESSNNGADVWTTELQAASVAAGSLEARSCSLRIRGDHDKITFSDLRMHCGPEQGMITGDGEMALSEPHAAHVALAATGVPITMFLGVQWQMKLSGLVSGNLTYESTDLSSSAHGQIATTNGKFNVLPWLGKVTVLVGLPDITDVEVDKATSDFEWKEGALHLTSLDIRKNNVVRISGDAVVDAQSQVDSHLKLGLPSIVTARWPQLQDKVFSDQHEDFNWADVHVTGSPDHLQEDLTSRVLAVGVDQGSGVIDQATQKAMDIFKSFMGN